MKIASITLAGCLDRKTNQPRAFATIRRLEDSEYIEVAIDWPTGRTRKHLVAADERDDQWSMAEGLQEMLDGHMAATLRDWLSKKVAGEPVWSGRWASRRHGAEMIRIDLTAADVDYEDDRDRVADFHALRHTFISNLARAGVHPRNAQALARHSTIELTMGVYTHVSMNDLAKDVESLPASAGVKVVVVAAPPAAAAEKPADSAASPPNPPAVPEELVGLAANWDSLPKHIRNAIVSLAGA